MRVYNSSSVPQTWEGAILQPGDTWEDGEVKSRDPLDHDGDGKKGGSLPKAKRGRPPKAK